jgi:hypothetical protein
MIDRNTPDRSTVENAAFRVPASICAMRSSAAKVLRIASVSAIA